MDSLPRTDTELLQQFAADRDPDAFAELVARYYATVTGVARRILGDPHEAEDIAQATFVLVAEKAPSLTRRDSTGLARWIVGAAYRLAKNRQRIVGNRLRHERAFAAQQQGSGDPGIAETVASVDEAIAKLPGPLRDAVIARYLRGLTYRETALELHVPTDTVRGRLVRAKALLREHLSAQGGATTAVTLGAVLTSAHDSSAAPPDGLVSQILACARLPGAPLLPGNTLWKVAAVVAATAGSTWLIFSPPTSESSKKILHHAQSPVLLGSSPDGSSNGFAQSRVDEWDALIAERLGGDLAPPRREVVDEDNGYFAVLRLSEAWRPLRSTLGDSYFHLQKMAQGTDPWDAEFAATTLDAASLVFDIFDEVLAAPDLQFPVEAFRTPGLHGHSIQDVCEMLKPLQAESLLRNGHPEAALETAVENLGFGRRVVTGQGNTVLHYFGASATHAAHQSIARILESDVGSFPPEQLRRTATLLEDLTPQPQEFEAVLGAEYIGILRYVRNTISGTSDPEALFHFPPAPGGSSDKEKFQQAIGRTDLGSLARFIDEHLSESHKMTRHPFQSFDVPHDDITAAIPDLSPDQLAGLIADNLACPSRRVLGMEIAWIPRNLAAHRLLETRIALGRAQRDGTAISHLQDLVPTYLAEVPTDPYDGQPLRYKPDEGVIYSIGEDLTDSGGTTSNNRPLEDRDELVVRVPSH